MMASIAASARPMRAATASALVARQPLLAVYGFGLLLLAIPLLALQLVDPRTLNGISVWVKPVKFLVSVGVFALTAAWFFGYIRPERRKALLPRAVVAMIIGAGSLELAWIGWQASQGLE